MDINWWFENKGRPCPRVELAADLAIDAEVLGFSRHPDVKHLAGAHFRALATTLHLPEPEQLEILRRVHAVLSDGEVLRRLHPGPELPED